ncbi:MAG: ribonucleoside triphosphate reductase, partial [Caldiserica bacterium CG_4_8_14_3_um_filter_35_18]
TVLHFFLGEALDSGDEAKLFVRKVINNYKIPYITITPTFSICTRHGYIRGKHDYCPYCDEELAGGKGKKENVNKPDFFLS